MRRWSLLLLSLSVPVTARAAEVTCKRSPALTGACRMVRGSLGLTPGTGVTLEGDDGSRTLIKAPADSNADIAAPVMQNWLYWQSKTGSMHTRITGRFELCPLPAAAPNPVTNVPIQDVGCINSGTRITVDKSAAAGP